MSLQKQTVLIALRRLVLFVAHVGGAMAVIPGAQAQDTGMGGSAMSHDVEMARMFALADPDDATIKSVLDGDWSSPTTWNLGRTPRAGDRVHIPEGVSVRLDVVAQYPLRTLRLDGTLAFAIDRNTSLSVDTLVGGRSSVLTMGTQDSPVGADYRALLNILDFDDPAIDTDGGFERHDSASADFDPAMLGLGLLTHGRFESAGSTRAQGGALAMAPAAGDTRITVNFDPAGWQVGDEIVIAGTSRDALGDEKRSIASIDNRLITLDAALDKDHTVVAHTKAGLELAVHAINLERNVVIQTADQGRAATTVGHTYTNETLREDYTIDLFHDRGHVMFMHSNNVVIRNTRFHALGRTSKHGAVDDNQFNDAGELTYAGINPRARYALHFHRAGHSGTPGHVEGSVVDESPGWCYVNHGSHADFINNAAYSCDGAGFVTERGDELGSFVENISVRNTADEGKRRVALRFQARKPINDFGFGGHGFWLQGINVVARDNIASGAGREAFALYPLLFDNAAQTRFTSLQIAAAHRASFSDATAPDQVPLHTFENNTAYGSNIGLMVGEHRPDAVSLIDGFTAWMVNMGTSFNYSDSIRFDDLSMIGNLDTPEGLGAFAHHGTSQVTMNRPHVEGFALGVQLPRAGNQAVNLAPFKYSAVIDAYLNNVLNLHVLQIRNHDFLHADIVRPEFGTLSDAALIHGIAALGAIDQNDDLDIDASNVRSNGFAELADEVAENRYTSQQDYYLHYTQTAGPTVDTRHQRDGFLPRRITVADAQGKQWRLFFKKQQQRDFVPFPTTIYRAGVDYDLARPLDPDAPGNNRNSNLPERFLDASIGDIATLFQRDAANARWADFAQAKDRAGSRWDVNAAVDYPGFALASGGSLLPTDFADNPRYEQWPRSTNLVAMRVDDLPDYIDYAGTDLEAQAQVIYADACVDMADCLPDLLALDNTQRRFDTDTLNGRSLYLGGAYDMAAPYSLEHKSFTWHTSMRALDTSTGTLLDAGDQLAGFQVSLVPERIQIVLRVGAERYFLNSDELVAGNWVHVALMVNQGLGEAVLTVNGERVDSTAITPFRSSGGSTWRLGNSRVSDVGSAFSGFVDDMAFSERTYTDAALLALATRRAMPSPSQADRDADNDGYIDTIDRFPLNAGEYGDSDGDGTGDFADLDDDADGLPDSIENRYGLDPLNAGDAFEDLDADGVNNLDEYLSGTLLDVDSVDPWVLAPADLVVPARGTLTAVELGIAEAGDHHDGNLIATPSNTGPFAPGQYSIVWSVVDQAGNRAEALQQLVVQPQLYVAGPRFAVEGASVSITLLLNGDAATYPVRIPYHFEGSADATDFRVLNQQGTVNNRYIEIVGGRDTTMDIELLNDALIEGDDTIELVLGHPENAVPGDEGRHSITLREANTAPQVALTMHQANRHVSVIELTAGQARLKAQIQDINTQDSHTLDWSASDPELLEVSQLFDDELSFDPGMLTTGTYIADLRVTDDGDGQLQGRARFSVVVLDTSAVIGETASSDIPDSTAGADLDSDMILEPPAIWSVSLGDGLGAIETLPIHRLRIGATALAAGNKLPLLEPDDHIETAGANDQIHEAGYSQYQFSDLIFDVEVHDMQSAGTTLLVFPVNAGIAKGASLRRLSPTGQWAAFDTSGNDTITSLAADTVACPVGSDPAYVQGLNVGDRCVALRLVDGGANDSDGMADGVVRLVFGLGSLSNPEPEVLAVSNSSVVDGTAITPGEHQVLTFNLISDDIGAQLHGLTLATSGELDVEDDISSITLYSDMNDNDIAEATEAVGMGQFTDSGRQISFRLNTPYRLSVGDNTFLVTYVFRGTR